MSVNVAPTTTIRIHHWFHKGETTQTYHYPESMKLDPITLLWAGHTFIFNSISDRRSRSTSLFSRGKKHGPFGGDGGHHFEARPPSPDCYLAFVSGRADLRLDAVIFHWRCPSTAIEPPAIRDIRSHANNGQSSPLVLLFFICLCMFLPRIGGFLNHWCRLENEIGYELGELIKRGKWIGIWFW